VTRLGAIRMQLGGQTSFTDYISLINKVKDIVSEFKNSNFYIKNYVVMTFTCV